MGKTIAINPSWYWPDEIPRLLGVPPFFCERLIAERWARRRPDVVAVVDEERSLTYAELWSRAQAIAKQLGERPETERLVLCGPLGVEGLLELVGALTARRRAVLLAPGGEDPCGAAAGSKVADVHEPALELLSAEGILAGHSHYSLLSGALSLGAFLGLQEPRAWLSAMPLWSWEGLYGALVPLYAGATAILCGDPQGATDAIAHAVDEHAAAYALAPFEMLRELTRGRPRRLADSIKRNLDGLILSTERPFAAGDRRKARKALDVPILTTFGLTETGPILASHPSWYVDESVGIPVTNVEVQPANPQTGEPLDTNWELLDHASMVIRAPQLMAGYAGAAAEDERLSARMRDGWFETWALASFDANGMMYLVDG